LRRSARLRRDRIGTGGTAWVIDVWLWHAGGRPDWVTLVGAAWPRARMRGEPVRARLLLTGTESRGRERSRRRRPEVGGWLPGRVLARLGAGLGMLATRERPLRELARSVLLLVLAGRLGTLRWGSLGELPGTMRPAGLLPGSLLASHRHSCGASVWRGWSIRVAALRELMLCLRTMRARLSLLLTMGARCGILPGAGRLRLALPAGFRPGGARPGRRRVSRGGRCVRPGGRIALTEASLSLRSRSGTAWTRSRAAGGVVGARTRTAEDGGRIARSLARRPWRARRAGHAALGAGTWCAGWHVGRAGPRAGTGARPVGVLVAGIDRIRLGVQERRVRVVITGVPTVNGRGAPVARPPLIWPGAVWPGTVLVWTLWPGAVPA
jgi:hypothetical protein